MSDIAVLVPVLARPERVGPLMESLFGSERQATFRLVFIVSKGDDAEWEAVDACGSDFIVMAEEAGPGDYARKINSGVEFTDEDWVFLAADDLCFCPGWADQALACAETSGKRVIGTNDLGNRSVIAGRHSTHTLTHRSYCQLERSMTRQGCCTRGMSTTGWTSSSCRRRSSVVSSIRAASLMWSTFIRSGIRGTTTRRTGVAAMAIRGILRCGASASGCC